MNEGQWEETQKQLRKLETLLPTLSESTDQRPSSILTTGLDDEALLRGRRRWITRQLQRGWRVNENGWLVKGEGKHRMEISPSAFGYIGATPPPWDVRNYNPRLHAPAALMGATWVGPNRFRMGALLVDGNASVRDEQIECPVCGAMPGDTYRRVRIENTNPFDQPWKQRFAPCPRCG